MNQHRNLVRLTIYFGVFATIAAGMIGLGHGSWNLPLLVGFCSIVSVIYTDILGWFSLHRWGVYIGMIGGALLAISDFLSDTAANQILEVGNLLVYVQLPLMFQKKSKRVFEQWGVFLLLELVVAALVNDNVLYGLMMLPVLAIGCASLMALALFASYLRHSESISESTTAWARLLHWLGKEQLVTKRHSGVTLSVNQPTTLLVQSKTARFAPSRWLRGILPLAFSVFLFSVAYFFCLPRLSSSSFQGEGWGAQSIGFNDFISLRQIGEMLQNTTPLFRMSMYDERKKAVYRPNFPPYIRMAVSHRYNDGPKKGSWVGSDSVMFMNTSFTDIPEASDLQEKLVEESDAVTVHIIEKNPIRDFVASIPPYSQGIGNKDMFSVRRDWRLVDTRDADRATRRKRRFSYSTYAFTRGQDSLILPDIYDCLQDVDVAVPPDNGVGWYRRDEVLEFPKSLQPILPIRDKILVNTHSTDADKLTKAIAIENYLANGPDFEYSLSLTSPIDNELDPIADFLINKRKGHCQYFASALAMLLRSMDIPTRIVIGFRPSEYNELGQYFLVQQNHAHVWVEAYFTVDELNAKGLVQVPDWVTTGAWLRLDGTPSGEGSNAGGTFRAASGQTLDVMQDLWTEMVINMDKSKQSTMLSLFGESSGGTYSNVWLQLQSLLNRLQSSRFIGGFLSPDRWFSWRAAVQIILFGLMLTVLYRVLLWLFPNWMPRLRRKAASGKYNVSTVDFYNRAIKLLKRYGLHRQKYETQREFFQLASAQLGAYSIPFDAELMSRLFYERRFGGVEKLSDADQSLVESSLQTLESNVSRWKQAKRGS